MQDTARVGCVILAAGEGKRMHAKGSKVMCEVAMKPMLRWVIDAAHHAGIEDVCIVASSDDVRRAASDCVICEQTERLGTGHAVMCASSFLEGRGGDTLVLCGDAPFVSAEVIEAALAQHRAQGCDVTVISAVLDDPAAYGRIVREGDEVLGIVEAVDCTAEQRAIREINSGAYWFRTEALLTALKGLKNDNVQKEYYLTDSLSVIRGGSGRAGCYTAPNGDVVLGANDPTNLLLLNELAKQRIIAKHLENGVHFIGLDGIVIGPDVEIAPGAEILPGTILYGKTRIGAGSIIGPNSLLEDAVVGENTQFNASQGRQCRIGSGVTVGPFAHLRPDAVIGDGAKLGDFVEVKNATVGEGTSVAHLTYIGDSDIGRHCNFGCGVVFANYDGENKYRSEIGDYAFIGCNTNIISPVHIGSRVYAAAGTTITKDVPDGALAIGRPETRIIEGWGDRKLQSYVQKKSK